MEKGEREKKKKKKKRSNRARNEAYRCCTRGESMIENLLSVYRSRSGLYEAQDL